MNEAMAHWVVQYVRQRTIEISIDTRIFLGDPEKGIKLLGYELNYF